MNRIDFGSLLGRKAVTLYQKEKVLCLECESPYLPVSGMDSCPSCRKKKDLRAGFFAMMGMEIDSKK